MNQQGQRHSDEDFEKGALEGETDGGNVATPEEQGVPTDDVAVTENAVGSNAGQVANAEHTLGADEDGTPG